MLNQSYIQKLTRWTKTRYKKRPLKGGVADFEVGLTIQVTHRVSIIPPKNSGRGHRLSGKPLYRETTQMTTLGKPPKQQPSPSARTPMDRAKVMLEDLTLFFSASKKDITLYPLQQTIKKLALVFVWVVSPKLLFGWFPQRK